MEAMFAIAATSAVYYYWYELIRSKMEGESKKVLSINENMISGAIAGAGADINFSCTYHLRNLDFCGHKSNLGFKY
jgi:hypothetical protein